MINTVNTKQEQLTNGYFKIGSGKEWILIIGSCRSVPYLNYFNKWNLENNNRFTIAFVDPFNFLYDRQDNRIDGEAKINSLETDAFILELLKSTSIIVHEYYANYGMFSFDKEANKNIYHFGLKPEIDICIPNFNDNFILFKDIISFDLELRKKALQDWNVLNKLSEQTQQEIFALSQKGVQRFYDVCRLSDIPEMGEYFEDNFRIKRLFHTYNHVSKNFTVAIFNFISDKWLNLNLPEDFYNDLLDIFASSFTPLTGYDKKWWHYEWGEEIKSIL